MRRTLRIEQVPAADVQRGEVLVATTYIHPERGSVQCAASPLLAAALRKVGLRVREGPVAVSDGTRCDGGVLFAVSYVDRQERVAGFGVAAHPRDDLAVATARRAALEWSRVLRSRRLLRAQALPMCWGARRSMAMIVAGTASGGPPVYVLGRPALRDRDVAALAVRGVRFADDLADVPVGARVALPAHGVSLAARAELRARGSEVIDSTCPLVAAGHADVRSYAGRGDTVVLIGGRDHVAAETFAGQGGEAVMMVRDVRDLAGLVGIDAERVSFVVQTGVPAEDAAPLVEALRARYPALGGFHYDVWCYAASDRTETIRSVAAASDVVLVVGAADHDDTAHVATVARNAGTQVRVLEAVGGLVDVFAGGWLTGAGTIGLATTWSTAPGLDAEIARVLAGLGPLSVVARSTSTCTGNVGPDEMAAVFSDPAELADPATATAGVDRTE